MKALSLKSPQKKMTWLKRIFIFLSLILCFFGLTSCASTKREGNYSQTPFFNYDATSGKTTVRLEIELENPSIFDIKKVYYTFQYFNNDTLLGTTDEIPFDISLKHGDKKIFTKDFTLTGNVNKLTVVDWANLWESYEGWFIGTIIGVVVIAIALAAAIILTDGELIDFFAEYFWIAIPIVIVPVVILIISAFGGSWVPACIIGGGIVAAAILVGLFFLLFYLYEEFDLDEYFEGKYVALAIIALLLIGGFVCGCIFWKWWACLLILLGVILFIGLVLLLSYLLGEAASKRERRVALESETEDDEPVDDFEVFEEEDSSTKEEPQQETTKPKSEKRKITFDDIAGLDAAKEAFNEKVILPFKHPEIYAKFGKKAGGGILLYGLPGTGKTMFAEAASNEVNATFIPIKCSDIKSKWYGESEKRVKAIFAKARKSKKAIIFFDEFEAIGAKRTDDSNANNDLVPQILAEMQGIGSSNSESTVVVIAATNKPWSIDSAFMRPGRFDEKIYIPLPDEKARKRLFEIQLNKIPISDDLDFDYLVKITEGFNGADISEVCEKLKMSAIKDSLAKGTDQTIGMDDVKRIENVIKSSVSQEDIEELRLFEKTIR